MSPKGEIYIDTILGLCQIFNKNLEGSDYKENLKKKNEQK